MKKRILALALTLATCFSMGVSATNSREYMTEGITLTEISADEVPSYITPIEFETEEDAMAFLNSITLEHSSYVNKSYSRTTNGTVFVDSQYLTIKVGDFELGTVSLYANYGTTGTGNTGTISYISPYTTITGFTPGIDWTEEDIGYNIMSSGKDAYIYASGTVDYYLIVDGLVQIGSKSVNLNGTVYLVR